jgi:DNA-binding NarL/FixJ family response regulator
MRKNRRQSPLSRGLSLEQLQDPQRASRSPSGAREREALQLEIAFILRIAIQTLALHSDNIKRSLGLRTRAELTKYMIEQR